MREPFSEHLGMGLIHIDFLLLERPQQLTLNDSSGVFVDYPVFNLSSIVFNLIEWSDNIFCYFFVHHSVNSCFVVLQIQQNLQNFFQILKVKFGIFEIRMVLLVCWETLFSAIPYISERVVHRIIILDLSFGDFNKDIVTMNSQNHINVRFGPLMKIIK